MEAAQAAVTLPPETSSARRARRMVDGALAVWERDDLREVAALLASELVANSVLHARTPIELRLRLRPSGLRVEVRDGDIRLPSQKHYGPDAATGRGLVLVEELSTSWGAEMVPDGKLVWFELVNGRA